MRLSTMKGDPAYQPPEVLRKYEVFFNGKQETICEVADEEQGYICRVLQVRDPYTRRPTLRRSGRIYGKVEIREIK